MPKVNQVVLYRMQEKGVAKIAKTSNLLYAALARFEMFTAAISRLFVAAAVLLEFFSNFT